MSAVAASLLLGDDGYQISRSVRLRSSASAYLNRTPSVAGSRTTWTWSGWVKRGTLGSASQTLFEGGTDSSNWDYIRFNADNIQILSAVSTINLQLVTTQVFRDPSAWYHVVFALDTTQATASNRAKLYVNGVQVTTFSTATYPAQNYVGWIDSANAHRIGANVSATPAEFFDGYLTEVNFIDGQALTPASFGENDAVTGVWKPKKYSGTYGTNGFYLNFSDNSAATPLGLGKDSSGNTGTTVTGTTTSGLTTMTVVSATGLAIGNAVSGAGIQAGTYVTNISGLNITLSQAANATSVSTSYVFSGNNWTPNNISLTAGVTYDSMIDTPTPYADGGNGRGNYCTLNPLGKFATGGVTVSDGNLSTVLDRSTYNNWVPATIELPSTGKFYFEVQQTAQTGGTGPSLGVGLINSSTPINQQTPTNYRSVRLANGDKSSEAGAVSYGSSFALNDICQVAIDVDGGRIWFGKNGTWFASGDPVAGTNAAYTDIVSAGYKWFPAISNFYGNTTNTANANFGQRPFAYTPPTGFKALNTQNLPDSTIKKGSLYFDATTYTGNGSNQTITNGGFQPDMFWGKSRSAVNNHGIVDSVRGGTAALYSNLTNAEGADGIVNSWNSNGVSLGNSATTNTNGQTYVGWQWKKGATQGFDIVTYTGNGTNQTIAHSLGVAPKMMLVKQRSGVARNWFVYHASLGATQCMEGLNTTSAATTQAAWNNTSPTSSVFSVGANSGTNNNADTYVAYLFAEVAGFSKFGSYTGNGSADGPFVYCGFRPKFVLIKSSSVVSSWTVIDTSRDTYNVATNELYPNLSNAEGVGTCMDVLSNGFKLRNSDNNHAGSGQTYIFAAFAENPFKNSLAR